MYNGTDVFFEYDRVIDIECCAHSRVTQSYGLRLPLTYCTSLCPPVHRLVPRSHRGHRQRPAGGTDQQ